jgi:hypothetical protein
VCGITLKGWLTITQRCSAQQQCGKKFFGLRCETCDVSSALVKLNNMVCNENLLDVSPDIDELKELYNMAIRPQVWQISSNQIAKLERTYSYKGHTIK